MKVAVIRFPGSNCDQDAFYALRNDVGVDADYVWHEQTSLKGFDAVFLPGGFSYGDYLRCGAMASRAPIMQEVRRFANEGHPVIGACNGFQILCEAGLLPGALLLNQSQKFVCKHVTLEVANHDSLWTRGIDRPISVPIAHGEGRYVADAKILCRLNVEKRIAFRYMEENPNGSVERIAGVLNTQGNVLGLMPHPERATRKILGSEDGLLILNALKLVTATV
jgi:phosphoribosylformylglycinamidine synthase